ncbi:DUF2141 domain-containing protein [Brevundimonas sp.]|uniref:DUF2141 domain-containing protein n=1 Tax=Brevundimonas sp. TaxID=1871086 RepID=UPI0025F8A289|nr:DUF2141 domain-containing protein [Brevundimonas sp.]
MGVRVSTVAAGLALLGAGAAHAGDVTVTLDGVQARGGTVYVTLQTEGEFMQRAGLAQRVDSPQAGAVTVTFRDVPAGAYALSAFHDENGDQRMQASPIGVPTEGWAMSNADALRGPPTFDVVSIQIGEDGAALSETMRYWDGQPPMR